MHYLIYKITNIINNKIYIGAHKTNNINDGYMGSGKAIIFAIKKHGIQNFIKGILFDFDSAKEMFDKEKELAIVKKGRYNLKPGGSGGAGYGTINPFYGKRHTDISKEKMRRANLGKRYSIKTEFKKGIIPWSKENPPTIETKEKISNTLKRRHANGEIIPHHIRDIRLSLFREFYRVLRDGGYFTAQMGFGYPSEKTVMYSDNHYDATETNRACDTSVEDPKQLEIDLYDCGFKDFNHYITPVGPGDLHPNWIFFNVRK
jgi:hypothetical protein